MVLLGGDIHVGVESVLIDKTTGATIKSITASPITNHVCAYFEDPEGDFNERYAFKNKPLPSTMRNYCVVELKFSNSGSSCTQCLIRMEQIPTGGDGKDDH